MPVASEISTAVYIYRRTESAIAKSVDGLTTEEWQRRPDGTMNSMLWIVGHNVWARSRILALLGHSWEKPWLPLFGRGHKPSDTTEYPLPEEVMLGWKDVTERMAAVLEEAPAAVFAAPSPENAPSFDGTMGGMLSFMAFHESYHAGQLSYVRNWLRREGAVG